MQSMPEAHSKSDESPTGVVTEPVDQSPSSTAPSESTGGSSPEVRVKLNAEADLDDPTFVKVPSWPEVKVTSTPVSVPAEHAALLLETNFVVSA